MHFIICFTFAITIAAIYCNLFRKGSSGASQSQVLKVLSQVFVKPERLEYLGKMLHTLLIQIITDSLYIVYTYITRTIDSKVLFLPKSGYLYLYLYLCLYLRPGQIARPISIGPAWTRKTSETCI